LLRIVLTMKTSRKNMCIQLFLEKQYLTHGEAWIKYLMNIYTQRTDKMDIIEYKKMIR
jgi:hypothetical protein